MKHGERLLWEMEKRGGAITTGEIAELRPHIMQYNRVVLGLRRKGYVIEMEESKIHPSKNTFRLISRPETSKPEKPVWTGKGQQLNLFGSAA